MDNINNIIKREIVPGTTTEIHGTSKLTILWLEKLTYDNGKIGYRSVKKVVFESPSPMIDIDINSPSSVEINKPN
jgi:hypothetical protein